MNNEDEILENEKQTSSQMNAENPTLAYKGASWGALLIGVAAYLIGLFNATMHWMKKAITSPFYYFM